MSTYNLPLKPILLSLAATLTLHASNGDLMIATGAKSMGMGGVGIAIPFGAESGLNNPALITSVKESEVSGSATFFFPSIDTKVDSVSSRPLLENQRVYQESDASFYLIPSIAYATDLGSNWYAGIGIWGIAGMGVDFSDAPANSWLFGMQTDLMIMHIAAPVAYKSGNLSVGIAPIIQVGMLNIEFDAGQHFHPYDKEWDANVGVKVGAVYDFGNGLRAGAVYKTPISMTYENSDPLGSDLKLEQPQEYGIGLSYSFGAHTVAMDYKRIDWDKADGYKAFGWESEDLFAVGYQYSMDQWALRAGYNHAKSPIDTTAAQPLQNYLNLLGFPATSEDHYTVGATYDAGGNYSVDFAADYSPEETKSGVIWDGLLREILITNRHEELSMTLQLNYRF
jgi:long-chain fatty acid transport protein